MTITQFEKQQFTAQTKIIYGMDVNTHYKLVGVDFEEMLIEIRKVEPIKHDHNLWVRCENVEIV